MISELQEKELNYDEFEELAVEILGYFRKTLEACKNKIDIEGKLIIDSSKTEDYSLVAGSLDTTLRKLNLNLDTIQESFAAIFKNIRAQNLKELKSSLGIFA